MMNWIDIKKQKPEHRQAVLITDGEIVTSAVVDSKTLEHIWWDGCAFSGYEWEWDFNTDDITHWMPLPEPPHNAAMSG